MLFSFTAMSTADKIQSQIDELDADILGLDSDKQDKLASTLISETNTTGDVTTAILEVKAVSDAAKTLSEESATAALAAQAAAEEALELIEDGQVTPTSLSEAISTHNTASDAHNDKFALKANVTDVYTKTAADSLIATKVDKTGAVTGIKGNAESTYRTGNINITAANIGTLTQAQITSLIEGIPSAITFADTTQLVDWLNGDYERPDGILPASRLVGFPFLTLPQNEPDYWVVNTPPQSLEDLQAYTSSIDLSEIATILSDIQILIEFDLGVPNLINQAISDIPAADIYNNGLMTSDDKIKLDILNGEITSSNLDDPLVIGTIYELPELTDDIEFKLPTGTASGQKCEVKFSCGTTPYLFTVTGTNYTSFSLTPLANTVYSVVF